jgi:hypothetical protein
MEKDYDRAGKLTESGVILEELCEQLALDLCITLFYSAAIIEAYAAPDVTEHNGNVPVVSFFIHPRTRLDLSGENYGQRQSKVVRQ